MKMVIQLLYAAALLLITPKVTVAAMVDAREEAPAAAIIVINGPWAESTEFAKSGAFYDQLVTEITVHNAKSPHLMITIEEYKCDEAFEDIFDGRKIRYADNLTRRILEIKEAGTPHVHLFAHGQGIDIAALTSQLLDARLTELMLTRRTADRAGSTEAMEFLGAMNLAKRAIHEKATPLTEPLVEATARSLAAFSLETPSKFLTVHLVKTPGNTDPVSFNQDLATCEFVHHYGLGHPGDSHEDGQVQTHLIGPDSSCCCTCCPRFLQCLMSCLKCCKACVSNPTVQTIASAAVKIIVMGLIAAV